MSTDDRDTQPPSARESMPSLPREDVEAMLGEQTTHFVRQVGLMLDPMLATLRALSETSLHVQHQLAELRREIRQDVELLKSRLESLEKRVAKLEGE